MTRSHLRGLCVFFAMLVIAQDDGLLRCSGAAEWNGTGGEFGDDDEWIGGLAPGFGDDAVFNLPGFPTVTFNNDPTTRNLQVTAGEVTFESIDSANPQTYTLGGDITIDGRDTVLSVFDLNVSAAGDLKVLGGGTLVIDNEPLGPDVSFEVDNVLIDDGIVGVLNGSLDTPDTGVLMIESEGTLLLDGGLVVTGQLINKGGVVDFSSGTLLIRGTNGLTVGPGGALGGDLLVGSGQTLFVLETTTIAAGSTLTIDNGGVLDTGDLDLSGGGQLDFIEGSLLFFGPELVLGPTGPLGGGFVLGPNQALETVQTTVPSGESLIIAGGDFVAEVLLFDGPGFSSIDLIDGTATIDDLSISNGAVLQFGPGEGLVLGGELRVGEEGANSTLDLFGGGTITSANGAIGDTNGSDAAVMVQGAGSRWTMTDPDAKLQIGNGGTGVLEISEGGEVIANGASIGDNPGSNGSLKVDGVGSFLGKTDGATRALDVGFRGRGLLEITGGGAVEAIGTRIAPSGTSTGTVLIEGAGSSLTNDRGTAVGATDTGSALLEVLGGGLLNDGNDSSIGPLGTATVDGAGSAWTIGDDLDIAGSAEARLTVSNGGTLSVADRLTIRGDGADQNGLLILNNAALNVGSLIIAGEFDWVSGTVGFTSEDGFTVGRGGDFGNAFTLDSGKAIDVTHTTFVEGGSTLTIDGGELSTDELSVSGTGALFIMESGTASAQRVSLANRGLVRLNGGEFNSAQPVTIGGGAAIELGGGTLNTPSVDLLSGGQLTGTGALQGEFSGGVGSLIVVSSDSLSVGDAESFLGFSTGGSIRVEAGATLSLLSKGFARLGPLTTLNGGTLVASGGAALTQGSNLVGHGTLTGRIAAGAGSIIQAVDGDLTLGDAASFGGFVSSGEMHTGAHRVTLHDRNQAELGSVTTLGDGAGSPGTLAAPNSLFVDFGRGVQGHGTIVTPNDADMPLVNNGSIAGESADRLLTLSGFVKGVGSLDHVAVSGTFSPGFSPAVVSLGNVTYGDFSMLEIELGGLDVGEFDQLNHSGNATLGGTLQISLLDNFMPAAGDSFEILTYASTDGEFGDITGLDLGGGLKFDPQFSDNSLTLMTIRSTILADLTRNGFVDFDDLAVLLAHWNQDTGPELGNFVDFGEDIVDFNDLAALLAVWTGPGPIDELPAAALTDSPAVPEPSTVVLLVIGALAGLPLWRRRSRARRRS